MQRRSGFTLTELLVSMALIIFIMSILADAFDAGIGTFRRLKAVGDMNDKLRATSTILRKYLSADHFEGKRRLSDPNILTKPVREGFFRIIEGNNTTLDVDEGPDLDGLHSYRSVDHALHFSVKLRGNQRGEFFRANVPASPLPTLPFAVSHFQDGSNTYCSPWAEVAFFLRSINQNAVDPNNPGAAGAPLYALYLRQRLAVPHNSFVSPAVPTSTPLSGYLDMSTRQGSTNYYFNSAADLTMPGRRAMLNGDLPGSLPTTPVATPLGTSTGFRTLGDDDPTQLGNDLILTNVISFDVRVLLAGGTDFVSLFDGSVPGTANSSYGSLKVFDTWSQGLDDMFDYRTFATANNPNSMPLPGVSIQAIRVTIRVWDTRTAQTRQTSVIVDM